MVGPATRLIADRSGAVAPTIALSLFALIAAGGIAFDYARMASMDTELQNAADQAALAAASQLDGEVGACARAASAARNMIANRTLLANEAGGTRAITIADEPACDAAGNVRFYKDKEKTQPADLDENAKFVEVQVDPREAFFAFTPVVAAFSSGDLTAIAFAGLGEAICRVPPLMMCNPDEANDPEFTVANYVGKGNRLVANDGGGNYGPGNFGFLDVGQGANELRAILGQNGGPGDCASGSTVTTEPGNMITLRDALNTRFDMYENGLNQACGGGNSLCPPSLNSRKDLHRIGAGGNACRFSTNNSSPGWAHDPAVSYLPPSNQALTDAQADALAPMGYPRDICHAVSVTGVCTEGGGIIGDGVWDRYAYFRSHRALNYPEATSRAAVTSFMQSTFGTTTPSRYEIYEWEMRQANRAARLRAATLANGRVAHGTPVCVPPGVEPATGQIDRRILSVAVINCTEEGIKGKTANVDVTKYIDIFMVEPTAPRTRTEIADIYVEIVGLSADAAQNSVQIVKKAVPYLIE